jgi:sialidase-1
LVRKEKKYDCFLQCSRYNKQDNLTLRISYDDAETWKKNILIDKSSNKNKDYTAYSDIVKVSENKIGVLYEKDNYARIVFTVVKWE